MCKLLKAAFIAVFVHYSFGFNITELLSSGEKTTKLIKEESKSGKNSGYSVKNIKLSNEAIVQLMHKGTNKEQGEQVLRLISEYTVGMNENTLDIVMLNNIPTMWNFYEEIYNYGIPKFIEYNCDLIGMQARFEWDDGPVTYFKYIRKDALEAWNYFSKEIKCLDRNITQLMETAMTEEEAGAMQRFVSFYTGEMAGILWQMVEPYQPKDLWHVCKDIYSHGKPVFIDCNFKSERFIRIRKWTLDDIIFFSDLRTDANTVWEQFVETYREMKNKQHHTADETTVPTIVQVEM